MLVVVVLLGVVVTSSGRCYLPLLSLHSFRDRVKLPEVLPFMFFLQQSYPTDLKVIQLTVIMMMMMMMIMIIV